MISHSLSFAAIAGVFGEIPIVSDWAFWFMVAAYLLWLGINRWGKHRFKPLAEAPRGPIPVLATALKLHFPASAKTQANPGELLLQPELDQTAHSLAARHFSAVGSNPPVDCLQLWLVPALPDLNTLASRRRAAASLFRGNPN